MRALEIVKNNLAEQKRRRVVISDIVVSIAAVLDKRGLEIEDIIVRESVQGDLFRNQRVLTIEIRSLRSDNNSPTRGWF